MLWALLSWSIYVDLFLDDDQVGGMTICWSELSPKLGKTTLRKAQAVDEPFCYFPQRFKMFDIRFDGESECACSFQASFMSKLDIEDEATLDRVFPSHRRGLNACLPK